MANAADIQALIADVSANDIDFGDLAKVVKRALLNALLDPNGNVIIPYTSVGGDAFTATVSIEAAQNLLDFCLRRAGGGLVAQYVEFRDPSRPYGPR